MAVVDTITLSQSSVSLAIGQTVDIFGNTTQYAIPLTSADFIIVEGDPSIATAEFVSNVVRITGVGEGETTVKIQARTDGGQYVGYDVSPSPLPVTVSPPAYKKRLKDSNGNIIYPALGPGAIKEDEIDWDSFAGMPQLLSFACASAVDGGNPVAVNTLLAFSDPGMGTKTMNYRIDPCNLLTFDSGTFKYTHKKGAKFIHAKLSVTGSGYGMWQPASSKNRNDLNGAVVCNSGDHILKCFGGTISSVDYGGCDFDVYYDVRGMTPGNTLYINPQATVYRTDAHISRGGVVSGLVVKIYGSPS